MSALALSRRACGGRIMQNTSSYQGRYGAVAIAVHWLIALAIIGLILSGKWMVDAIRVKETQFTAFQIYQWHKSFGLTVLALSLFRLAWRLLHTPPPAPDTMPNWQRFASTVTHWAFYVLMIGTPVLGWLMVSASPLGLPTLLFGQLEVPHYPFDPAADKAALEHWFKANHELLANGTLLLLLLHAAAALKHHFVDKDNILWRMAPFSFLRRVTR
jgi:cytochrome b561